MRSQVNLGDECKIEFVFKSRMHTSLVEVDIVVATESYAIGYNCKDRANRIREFCPKPSIDYVWL